MNRRALWIFPLMAACAGTWAHAGSDAARRPGGAVGSRAACEGLKTGATGMVWPNAATVVDTAAWHTATPATATAVALPEHCEIVGSIARRKGADGQDYEIRFHLRMPAHWNGRFFMEGGGGTNGNLSAGVGSLGGSQTANALSRAFATISTDGGHNNATDNNPAALGIASFGMDPQARLDMGYNAYDQVTRAGKAAVHRFYGRAPRKSYYVGCSEGGREAMLMSQRFPTYYDGIVAGDPGFELPKAGIAGAWTSQAFAAAAPAKDAAGLPLLNKAFSDSDLHLLAKAILHKCDALDGLADGVIDNHAACQAAFDLRSAVNPDNNAPLQCSGAKTDACLSAQQIEALAKAMAGPKDSQGKPLYASWPWDAGISGLSGTRYNQGWRSWWLGRYAAQANDATRFVGFSAQSWLVDFATPPEAMPLSAVGNRMLGFDFDLDAKKIFVASGAYAQPSMQWDAMTSTDLRAFRDRGGKLILYHGMADAAFSANDTIDYYKALKAAMGERTPAFSRLFIVPGMNHCSGGPATDSFDMLSPLVAWVEGGKAPESVVAEASDPGYFGVAARSRPLCAYPKTAHYAGHGDINVASNFACR